MRILGGAHAPHAPSKSASGYEFREKRRLLLKYYLYLFTYTFVKHVFYVTWCSWRSTVIQRVSLVEQELLTVTIPEHRSSQQFLVGSFCSFFIFSCKCFVGNCLSFFFWPLCCMSFFWWTLWYLQTFLNYCFAVVT